MIYPCGKDVRQFSGNGKPYEALAISIVALAVSDWRMHTKWLDIHKMHRFSGNNKQRNEYEAHLEERAAIEDFFLSGYCYGLVGVDGAYIIDQLDREQVESKLRKHCKVRMHW